MPTAEKKLVIVESPTKARTIRKFLGKNYMVESCMGHVRDLPQSARDTPEKYKKKPWAHLGVNVDSKFEPIYCIPKTKAKVVKLLKSKIKEADELILATDEDREGESISWHLVEVLAPKIPVKRMVFHEITEKAIRGALEEFRDINFNLVRAQEARRILDRLVGYTISPLVWKKVAYGLSAGRVQSVAVRLISEREHERLAFQKATYWSLTGNNEKDKTKFESRLLSYQGKRVALGKDFDSNTGQLLKDKVSDTLHLEASQAAQLINDLKGQKWTVDSVEEKPISRKPAPPFITSTLQQEASRKLGLSTRETMQVAQKLYEQGFITYMRTDSTNLSNEAIEASRKCIEKLYGKEYLPSEPRLYTKKKAKGAQEAHEAIRPAGTEFPRPEETTLKAVQLALYDLIWKRTVASQMVNSAHKQVSARFSVGDAIFSTTGTTIEFPGFLKAYVEGSDDPEAALDNREVHLPSLKKGEAVSCLEVKANEHQTKPAARYTEASLVQKLEKDGIGRPSTYASIIGTIQDRGYVKKVGQALTPTFTALVVSRLLEKSLPNYVDENFTSSMEDALDEIAQGDLDFQKYLSSIYLGDKGLRAQVDKQTEELDADSSRTIELAGLEGLSFRVGRYGAYVCKVDAETGKDICASLPESQFPADMTAQVAHKLIDQKINGTDALGKDPETGLPIYVLTGRYGPYVQLGDDEGGTAKPKRASIPEGMFSPDDLTLNQAVALLSLPRVLGDHPESGKEVKAGLGRFGPYVVHDGDFRSIPKTDSLFEINLERALELLAQPKRGRGRAAPLKDLGKHPELSEPMGVYSGRYGPYVKCGKINVSLPDNLNPEDVTKEQAIELLADKVAAQGNKKAPAGGRARPAKKKTTAAAKRKKA